MARTLVCVPLSAFTRAVALPSRGHATALGRPASVPSLLNTHSLVQLAQPGGPLLQPSGVLPNKLGQHLTQCHENALRRLRVWPIVVRQHTGSLNGMLPQTGGMRASAPRSPGAWTVGRHRPLSLGSDVMASRDAVHRHPWGRRALPIRYPADTLEAREPLPFRYRSATDPTPLRRHPEPTSHARKDRFFQQSCGRIAPHSHLPRGRKCAEARQAPRNPATQPLPFRYRWTDNSAYGPTSKGIQRGWLQISRSSN